MRILTVFGTRPEAIKMAPVVLALRKNPAFQVSVCVTSQHGTMLEQGLQHFKLEPQHDLRIMSAGQTMTQVTTRVLEGLEGVFLQEKPDLVLVHGDTTTTLAAALAAFYARIAVGHVEAGLRTYRKDNPFPEEMNRQITDALADYHFAPTEHNRGCLLQEGYEPESIYVTGNTVVDVVQTSWQPEYQHPVLTATVGKERVFVTTHRRESFGKALQSIVHAVRRLADLRDDSAVIFPVHYNPHVQETVRKALGDHPRIHLLDPLDVVDCHNILGRCSLLLTDSGGLQEEGPSLGVPVLVLRLATERPEGIYAGVSELVGVQEDEIVAAATRWLDHPPPWLHQHNGINPYGDGQAAARIAQVIAYQFGFSEEPPTPFFVRGEAGG